MNKTICCQPVANKAGHNACQPIPPFNHPPHAWLPFPCALSLITPPLLYMNPCQRKPRRTDSFSMLQRIPCAISDTMRSPVASCCRAVRALARPAGVPAHTWRPALRLCQAGRGHRITCKAAPPFHSLTQPFHTLTQHDAYCKVNLHERQGRPPERPLPKRPQPSTGVAPAPASVAVAPDRRPAGRQCRQRMPRQAHNHLARVNHSFVCAAMVQHMPRKQKTCKRLQLAQLR